jgi:hypothetical protein
MADDPVVQQQAEAEALVERLRGTFLDDVHEARRRLDPGGQQFDRRTYIRAFFASVEGLMFAFNQTAIAACDGGFLKLEPAEVAVLREETYHLSDNGIPSVSKKYASFLPRCRFVVAIFARSLGVEYRVPVDGAGWQAFREAVDIRDRVTHPRSLENGQLSDEDLQLVHQAHDWYEGILASVFEAFRQKRAKA